MINFNEYLKDIHNLFNVKIVDGIFQLTDDPDINLNDEESYIGYEHVGEYYSGKDKSLIYSQIAIGNKISEIVGDGLLLDLACGDGYFTVPIAKNNTNIIGFDISNKMLSILKYRAKISNISLDNVILARANAYNIPLKDNSVDYVFANSVLHLLSNPKNVLKEIYRVLKDGGVFLSIDDIPGQDNGNEYIDTVSNKRYQDILYEFDRRYWEIIKKEHNLTYNKLSWNIDKDKLCDEVFKNKEIILFELGSPIITTKFKDEYLYRHGGKGYSAQSIIPDQIHYDTFNRVIKEFEEKYGHDFYDYEFQYKEKSKFKIVKYIK